MKLVFLIEHNTPLKRDAYACCHKYTDHTGVSKLFRNIYMHIPAKKSGTNLIHHFFYSLQVKMVFIFIKMWTTIKIIVWNLNIRIQKIKFYWNMACSLIYELFLTPFILWQKSWVWPTNSKILIIWPIVEHAC